MSTSCEIRMLRGPEAHLDGASLFWLELFDFNAELSLDSGCGQKIEHAVPAFAISQPHGEPL